MPKVTEHIKYFWIAVVTVVCMMLSISIIEDVFTSVPEYSHLTSESGILKKKSSCIQYGKFDHGIEITISSKNGYKTIEVPCANEFERMYIGTEVTVMYREIKPLFKRNRKEVWEVKSTEKTYYSYQERVNREEFYGNWPSYILLAVIFLIYPLGVRGMLNEP